MITTVIAGHTFQLDIALVETSTRTIEPEPIHEHYVVVVNRRFPPKQVLATVTGLDRADFTTHQARSILRRVGLTVLRRGDEARRSASTEHAADRDRAADVLRPFQGRFVAHCDGDILFDADRPETVIAWLRRYGKRARVFRVPSTDAEIGSSTS